MNDIDYLIKKLDLSLELFVKTAQRVEHIEKDVLNLCSLIIESNKYQNSINRELLSLIKSVSGLVK